MLKKEIIMSVLIAVFSISLTGIAFADYGGEDIFDSPFADIEQATKADAKGNQTPANNLPEVINPLFCNEDLVEAAEHAANNDCTQEDLILNMG